jgi:hypothetical protein
VTRSAGSSTRVQRPITDSPAAKLPPIADICWPSHRSSSGAGMRIGAPRPPSCTAGKRPSPIQRYTDALETFSRSAASGILRSSGERVACIHTRSLPVPPGLTSAEPNVYRRLRLALSLASAFLARPAFIVLPAFAAHLSQYLFGARHSVESGMIDQHPSPGPSGTMFSS